MNKDEIFLKIENIFIREFLDVDDVKLEDTRGSLGLDSLDELEMLIATEDEFNIEIADEEAQACTTVADLVALVEAKINSKN